MKYFFVAVRDVLQPVRRDEVARRGVPPLREGLLRQREVRGVPLTGDSHPTFSNLY